MKLEDAMGVLAYKVNMYDEDVYIGNLDKTNIEAIKTLLNAYKELEKENEELKHQIKIKDAYFFGIWALGCDYDGYSTSEDLKGLIDELVEYADKGANNNDTSVYSHGWDENNGDFIGYNVLGEEVGRVKLSEGVIRE